MMIILRAAIHQGRFSASEKPHAGRLVILHDGTA